MKEYAVEIDDLSTPTLRERVTLRNKWFAPGVTVKGNDIQVMLSDATAVDSTDDGCMKVRTFINGEKHTGRMTIDEAVMGDSDALASTVQTQVFSWAMAVQRRLDASN